MHYQMLSHSCLIHKTLYFNQLHENSKLNIFSSHIMTAFSVENRKIRSTQILIWDLWQFNDLIVRCWKTHAVCVVSWWSSFFISFGFLVCYHQYRWRLSWYKGINLVQDREEKWSRLIFHPSCEISVEKSNCICPVSSFSSKLICNTSNSSTNSCTNPSHCSCWLASQRSWSGRGFL